MNITSFFLNPKRIFISAIMIFILLWLYAFLFGDFGYLQYRNLKKKKAGLEEKIVQDLAVQQGLVRERDLLKSESYIERIARERFSFGKPGERIYTFPRDTLREVGKK